MDMQKNNLVLNTNHEIFNKILQEGDLAKKETMISQLLDLALLSQQMLKGEALSSFVKRSLGMLG
jgi:molecular chaperone HtpG